jgi:hypothetical protein
MWRQYIIYIYIYIYILQVDIEDIKENDDTVSAPVYPHVLIIVKTPENRVEHILAMLKMT